MTTAAEPRAVVSWAGPGELAVPLLPKRALTLAQELLTCGVQAIKVDWPGQGSSRGGGRI